MRERRQHDPVHTTGIADECAAFLAGNYLDYVRSTGRPVPAWAYLNRLAHGDADEIERLGTRTPRSRDRTGWTDAIVFMASELVTVSRVSGVELAVLQAEVLQPIELHLAARPWTYVSPNCLADRVRAALRQFDTNSA